MNEIFTGVAHANVPHIVTIVQGEDWAGLYYDGNLKSEDHSIRLHTVLDMWVNYPPIADVVFREANNKWLNYLGYLPLDLKDVVYADQEWEEPEPDDEEEFQQSGLDEIDIVETEIIQRLADGA